MSEIIKAKWDEAESTGEPIDIGEIVICDVCDRDYTDLHDEGGFIFSSIAYCPACAASWLPRIRQYGEERFIRAHCPSGVSFADFARDYRGPNNFIQIYKIVTTCNDYAYLAAEAQRRASMGWKIAAETIAYLGIIAVTVGMFTLSVLEMME